MLHRVGVLLSVRLVGGANGVVVGCSVGQIAGVGVAGSAETRSDPVGKRGRESGGRRTVDGVIDRPVTDGGRGRPGEIDRAVAV